MQRYRITLKPYRDEVVNQPLNITQDMDLTDEQVAGLYIVVRHVSPAFEDDTIMSILKWDGKTWIPFTPIEEDYYLQQTYAAYTEGPHEIFPGAKNTGVNWQDYLQRQQQVDPVNIMAPITKRYIMIFPSYIYANLLYQFDTPEFLQGLITGANWLNVNWRAWILDVHEGNTEIIVT